MIHNILHDCIPEAVLVPRIWLPPLTQKEVESRMSWIDPCPLMYPLVSLELKVPLYSQKEGSCGGG